MEVADPSRSDHLEHSGTWNGHRLAMVAGRAALRALDREAIERLNSLGDYFADGVRIAAAQTSVPVSVTSCGSMLNLHAAADVATPSEARDAACSPLAHCLHLGLVNRGIFLAMRGEMCIATPMDEETIDEAVAAVSEVLAEAERHSN